MLSSFTHANIRYLGAGAKGSERGYRPLGGGGVGGGAGIV